MPFSTDVGHNLNQVIVPMLFHRFSIFSKISSFSLVFNIVKRFRRPFRLQPALFIVRGVYIISADPLSGRACQIRLSISKSNFKIEIQNLNLTDFKIEIQNMNLTDFCRFVLRGGLGGEPKSDLKAARKAAEGRPEGCRRPFCPFPL